MNTLKKQPSKFKRSVKTVIKLSRKSIRIKKEWKYLRGKLINKIIMPEEMSTKKRKHSINEESNTKKEKREVLKKSRRILRTTSEKEQTPLVGVDAEKDIKLTKKEEEEEELKKFNNNNQIDNSISSRDENVSGESSVKRKRDDDVESENRKYVKTEEINRENKEDFKKPTVKKVFHKRISKNECLCTPVESEPQQKPEEAEAHIQVEEWRLHKFQSPIELKHDESIHHDHFDPLEFHGHWDEFGEATLTNNGFTATLKFYDRELPLLKGGPLHEDEYIFEQLHFHWSEDDHSGCEHIFEGRAFSMEAHAVHFNQKYKDFQEAQDKPDGLAVVAFFIQATDNEDNPCFNKLSKAVQDIIKVNTTTKVLPDCLTWIKEEAQCKGYYTYQGSLTTEPYTESVTWILYPQPIHVSREQVASFRRLNSTPCEKHNIKQNVRPVQTPPEHKKLNVLYARSHRHSTSD